MNTRSPSQHGQRVVGRHGQAPLSLLRRTRDGFSDLLLSILGILGLLFVLVFSAGMVAQLTVIMFQTGSMSPTIPAGSVALVQPIDASEIRIGDVVTVDHGEALPITHRVREVRADTAGDARFRTIIMRGDANLIDDAEPYRVDRVQRVLFSVPGIAPVLVWFSHPLVLGIMTVVATVIVTRAFWPHSNTQEAPGKE